MVRKLIESLLASGDRPRAEAVADALIAKAEKGDVAATKLLIEMSDGKARRDTSDDLLGLSELSDEEIIARIEAILSRNLSHQASS